MAAEPKQRPYNTCPLGYVMQDFPHIKIRMVREEHERPSQRSSVINCNTVTAVSLPYTKQKEAQRSVHTKNNSELIITTYSGQNPRTANGTCKVPMTKVQCQARSALRLGFCPGHAPRPSPIQKVSGALFEYLGVVLE